MPPPSRKVEFCEIVELLIVTGTAVAMYSPPPSPTLLPPMFTGPLRLSLIVLWLIVDSLPGLRAMPPPKWPMLLVTVVRVIVSRDESPASSRPPPLPLTPLPSITESVMVSGPCAWMPPPLSPAMFPVTRTRSSVSCMAAPPKIPAAEWYASSLVSPPVIVRSSSVTSDSSSPGWKASITRATPPPLSTVVPIPWPRSVIAVLMSMSPVALASSSDRPTVSVIVPAGRLDLVAAGTGVAVADRRVGVRGRDRLPQRAAGAVVVGEGRDGDRGRGSGPRQGAEDNRKRSERAGDAVHRADSIDAPGAGRTASAPLGSLAPGS